MYTFTFYYKLKTMNYICISVYILYKYSYVNMYLSYLALTTRYTKLFSPDKLALNLGLLRDFSNL